MRIVNGDNRQSPADLVNDEAMFSCAKTWLFCFVVLLIAHYELVIVGHIILELGQLAGGGRLCEPPRTLLSTLWGGVVLQDLLSGREHQ